MQLVQVIDALDKNTVSSQYFLVLDILYVFINSSKQNKKNNKHVMSETIKY